MTIIHEWIDNYELDKRYEHKGYFIQVDGTWYDDHTYLKTFIYDKNNKKIKEFHGELVQEAIKYIEEYLI